MLNGAISSASDIGICASCDPWESVRVRFQTDILADLKRWQDSSAHESKEHW